MACEKGFVKDIIHEGAPMADVFSALIPPHFIPSKTPRLLTLLLVIVSLLLLAGCSCEVILPDNNSTNHATLTMPLPLPPPAPDSFPPTNNTLRFVEVS